MGNEIGMEVVRNLLFVCLFVSLFVCLLACFVCLLICLSDCLFVGAVDWVGVWFAQRDSPVTAVVHPIHVKAMPM